MKNLERRLSQIETQARDSMVYAKFRDQRGDVKMDFMRAAKLFLHGEVVAISSLDYDPPHDPLKDLHLKNYGHYCLLLKKWRGFEKCVKR